MVYQPLLDALASSLGAVPYTPEGLSTLLRELMERRQLNDDPDDWTAPSAEDYTHWGQQFLTAFPQIRQLTNIIGSAAKHVIYGDTDADGIIAQWILSDFLSAIGSKWEAKLYKRAIDGYGLHLHYFNEVPPDAFIWLLDLGSNDYEKLSHLLERFRLCIIDHHVLDEKCREAAETGRYILIHHQLPTGFSLEGIKNTSSAVLAFLSVLALYESLRQSDAVPIIPTERFALWLEAAAASIVSDVMPLRGLNRRLVRRALAVANHPQARTGLSFIRRLLQVKEAIPPKETINEGHLQKLSGMLNAANRTGKDGISFLALHALLGWSPEKAGIKNIPQAEATLREVIRSQETHYEGLESVLEQNIRTDEPWIVFLFPSEFPEARGQLGRFATRLSNQHKKPAVIALLQSDRIYGSARAQGIDLSAWISYLQANGVHIEGGGHREAIGFNVPSSEWEQFMSLSDAFFTQAMPLTKPAYTADIVVHADDMVEFCQSLPHLIYHLAPFGQENPPISLVVYGFDQIETFPYEKAFKGVDRMGGTVTFYYYGDSILFIDPQEQLLRLEVDYKNNTGGDSWRLILKEIINIHTLSLSVEEIEKPKRLIDTITYAL